MPHDDGELARADARSREDFLALAEAMPHLVWIAGPGGDITYFNRRWQEYTGVTTENLRSGTPVDTVHPDDLERTWSAWKIALESKTPYEIEYRLRRHADGSYRWFIARATPVVDADGSVVRWIGTATDIDAQRRTTDNLRFVLDSANALTALRDVDAICERLTSIAIERFADWCIVALDEGAGQYRIPAIAHRDPERVRFVEDYRDRNPVRESVRVANAIATNTSILIPSIDPAMIAAAATDAEHLAALESLNMQSAMIVPLSTGDERAIGALLLFTSESARQFDQGDLSAAEVVARQAASAIANARAFAGEQHTSMLLRFLATASRRLSETFDTSGAVTSVLTLATENIADLAYAWSAQGEALRFAAVAAKSPADVATFKPLIGERPFRPEGEILLLERFRGEPYSDRVYDRDTMRRLFYDYAYDAFASLSGEHAMVLPLQVHGRAIGALVFVRKSAESFSDAEKEVLSELARHATFAYQRAELFTRERRISTELQSALLPRVDMLPKANGISFDAVYQPSSTDTQIGGDWYDAFALPDGSLVISVGDVTGRGLGAAGLMGKLRQALGVVPLYERDPARMLDAVDILLRARGSSAIATAFIAVIDSERRTVRFANAGHPYPFLRRTHDIVALESHGLPLGLRDQAHGESATMSLEDARMLVLYTDGLTEATRDIAAGEEQVRQVLSRDAILFAKSPAKMLRDACLPHGTPDDAAILTVSFFDYAHWSFDADNARAAHDARSNFVTHLVDQGAIGDLASAELIFGELIGNVVRHAPGPIEVQLEWSGAMPVLHVTDRGMGFDRRPALPEDLMKESGRGLFIVESLSCGVNVEYIPGYGSHVAATLPVQRDALARTERQR